MTAKLKEQEIAFSLMKLKTKTISQNPKYRSDSVHARFEGHGYKYPHVVGQSIVMTTVERIMNVSCIH